MANLNKVMLMGNLTRDVELKYTQSNQAVANIGIAVNRRWRTPDGQDREEVTFIDCEAWCKQAEVMSKYLAKGRPVFIEGRLKLDQWENKEGQKQSKLRVVVENFQFIDSRGGAGGGGAGGGGEEVEARPQRPAAGTRSAPPRANAPEPIESDDIPF